VGTITYTKETVCYTRTDREELYADLYIPEKGAGTTPLLVMIHGGAWKAGSKEMNQEWGPFLAQQGYCVMSIDYRLATPEYATWPGVTEDVRAALAYMREHAAEYHVDPKRVGLIGDSCGAHLSVLLGLEEEFSQSVRAIVGVYGVYDVKQWWEHTQTSRIDDPVRLFMGGTPSDMPNAYLEASPMYRLEQALQRGQMKETPFLVVWGDEDEVVSCQQSKDFVQLLERYQVPHRAIEYPGHKHFWFSILPWLEGGGIGDEPNTQLIPELLDFLQDSLK